MGVLKGASVKARRLSAKTAQPRSKQVIGQVRVVRRDPDFVAQRAQSGDEAGSGHSSSAAAHRARRPYLPRLQHINESVLVDGGAPAQ